MVILQHVISNLLIYQKLNEEYKSRKEDSLIKMASAFNMSVKDLFDYENFEDRDKLISKINDIIKNANDESLQRYYKLLENVQ